MSVDHHPSNQPRDDQKKISKRRSAATTFIPIVLAAVVLLGSFFGYNQYAHAQKVDAVVSSYYSDEHQSGIKSQNSVRNEAIGARSESVKNAKASIKEAADTAKTSKGHVFAGDEKLLEGVDEFSERLSMLTSEMDVVSMESIRSSTVGIDSINSEAKSLTKSINDSVNKEKARIEEEKRKAEEERKRQEAAAAAAAEAARQAEAERAQSYASNSETRSGGSSGSSTGSSGSRQSSGNASAPAASAAAGATWSLTADGYCADWGCIQSSVDSSGAAYIIYPNTGLVEIAGHNYGPAGIIARFNVGDTVQVYGNGAGLYRVTGIVWTFKGASTSDVPAGFAFQTCVGSQMKLAYATKIG